MNEKSKKKRKSSKIVVRTILSLFGVIGLSFAFYVFITNSLESRDKYSLTYKEASSIEYSVCLKENSFYEEECLGKDMKYVASLINKINLNFKYSFTTDSEIYSTYSYSLLGKIIISDPTDKKILFTKNYDLGKPVIETVDNSKEYKLSKILNIDYAEYNSLANKFKSTYGLSSDARLEIHLVMDNSGYSGLSEELKFNKKPDLYVSIPLTQNSINIGVDYALINNTDTLTHQTKLVVGNYYLFLAAMLSLIIGLYILVDLVIFLNKAYNGKSEYEKKLSKLLREYDRLIVESPTLVNVNDYNIIVIKSFEELLDVHDNLKLPIIYNEVISKKESWLYIKNDEDLYLFILSLDNEKDKGE